MTGLNNTHWQQWDLQEARRLAAEKLMIQTQAYIRLNNLYLNIERGILKLNIHIMNELYFNLSQAYDHDDDRMKEWWHEEFMKLPNWLNV